MSIAGASALFAAMAVLAAIPSLTVLLVTTSAVSSGFAHGVAASAGVVLGDLVFVAVAVFGLALVAELAGDWFGLLRSLAGLYLIWLAWRLLRQPPPVAGPSNRAERSLWASAGAGFLLTLSDQKAALFYLAFLPAFVDLESISWSSGAIMVGITLVAVGGVKVLYAYAAARAGTFMGVGAAARLHHAAAAMLVVAGVAVLVRG